MQNRYVGDVGDYGKYALLRHLCAVDVGKSLRLAVVWCLFPDETLNNDGKHISYLKDSGFARLDPELHTTLNSIVSLGRRHVSTIAELGCLPPSTVFLLSRFYPVETYGPERPNASGTVPRGYKRA
jgi:hypothetical protein